MKTSGFRGISVCMGIGLMMLAQTTVFAQQPSEREKQLENMVHTLLQRVDELEQRANQSEAAYQSLKEQVENQKSEQPASSAIAPAPEKKANEIDWSWNNGLNFGTEDGAFKFKLGGRIHNDWYAGSIDDGDFPDGTRFRRLWLNFSGEVYNDYEFRIQYDLSGAGTARFKDVYVGYTGFDFMNLRLGQFKEPFSLEELTSSNYITLMERSPIDMLAPVRETGLMFYNEILDGRVTWAVGAFKNSNAFGDGEEDDAENGDWDVMARVTGLPWYEDNGAKLLHLGLAGGHREWSDDPLRIRSRGSFSRGDYMIDTGSFDADAMDLLGAEMALVYGPASIQAEYQRADIDSTLGGSDAVDGYYVMASYFLTGEHRAYKEGVFSRVKPNNNFNPGEGGWGAWEIAARYGYFDLTDVAAAGALGGKINDYTLGLNWYLNPNMRMMWNYVHSESDDVSTGDQDADIIEMRMQYDF
ncbi:MAG: porin [bacterium]|nr:porin [bacterium]